MVIKKEKVKDGSSDDINLGTIQEQIKNRDKQQQQQQQLCFKDVEGFKVPLEADQVSTGNSIYRFELWNTVRTGAQEDYYPEQKILNMVTTLPLIGFH